MAIITGSMAAVTASIIARRKRKEELKKKKILSSLNDNRPERKEAEKEIVHSLNNLTFL